MKGHVTLFVYDHFLPDFSAGGPVTSLCNLSQLLQQDLDIRMLTSAYVYTTGERMTGIEVDCWTSHEGIKIWYATERSKVQEAILSLGGSSEIKVYLNGMFSLSYFVYPLWFARRNKLKVVISPRGMLQDGALRSGKVKKMTYLKMLKMFGLLNRVSWHATDVQEAMDIRAHMGSNANVMQISNVPVSPGGVLQRVKKRAGELRLVYYSLIAEKKNLVFLLELLNGPGLQNVSLDIIGPIKDPFYWELCTQAIQRLDHPERIVVHGEISPDKSRSVIGKFHALVLPTHGENFGHAIVEMLACSRPVLISDKTPWGDVSKQGAGYSLELDKTKWTKALEEMLAWDQKEFDAASTAALRYYHSKFNFDDLKIQYLKLFDSRIL